MKTHELKTHPEYFQAIFNHSKDFELRKNDRDFKVGDELKLMEFDPEKNEYTGAVITVWVNYILHGGKFGLEDGYVIMNIVSY